MLILNHYKGNNSCTIEAMLTKLDVHQCIMVIYMHIKFHEIQLNGYLVMALDGHDGRTDWRTEGRTWRKLYPSAFGGG